MQRRLSQSTVYKISFQPHSVEFCPKPAKMQFFTHQAQGFRDYFSSFRADPTENLFDNPESIRFHEIENLRNIHRGQELA
jgi:hypothetical protein